MTPLPYQWQDKTPLLPVFTCPHFQVSGAAAVACQVCGPVPPVPPTGTAITWKVTWKVT